MVFNEEEKKRALDLGKRMGLDVSLGSKESGIFVDDKKLADIHDVFPEMNSLEFTEEECAKHYQALNSISKILGKRFEIESEWGELWCKQDATLV